MAADVPTLYLVSMLVGAFGAALLFLMSRRVSGPTLRIWALSDFAFCLGHFLFIVQPGGSVVLAGIIGNATLVLAVALMTAGLDAFDNRPLRGWAVAAGPLAVLVGSAVLFQAGGGVGARLLIIWVAGISYVWRTGQSLLRGRSHRSRCVRLMCVGVLAVFAAAYLLRSVLLATGLALPDDPVGQAASGVIRLLALGMIGSWNVCVLYLVLDREASVDDLTGLPNRGALMESARQMVAEANATGRPIAVLMMDLDRFKGINDQFGHAIGDQVLAAFAGVVTRSLRRGDLVGRVGGEEFCLMLPECGDAEARAVAERIRIWCERDLASVAGHPVAATVSIGLATRTTGTPSLPSLMHDADVALYAAKAAGRNQVVLSGDMPAEIHNRRALSPL